VLFFYEIIESRAFQKTITLEPENSIFYTHYALRRIINITIKKSNLYIYNKSHRVSAKKLIIEIIQYMRELQLKSPYIFRI